MMPGALLVAVVEDDEPSRGAIGRVLRASGFETVLFDSAEAFLKAPAEPVPLCLIVDVHLTGMSGFDLLTRLHETRHSLPIIITTGDREDAVRTRAQQSGCAAFLQKPFDSATLLGLIASIAREARP
jgi:FixJ family two-component response regulator